MISKLAKVLMNEWESNGSNGFFMAYFTLRTGYQSDTKQYAQVYEMIVSGRI